MSEDQNTSAGSEGLQLGDVTEFRPDAPHAAEWRGVELTIVSLRADPDGNQWVSVVERQERHRGWGQYDGETTDIDASHLRLIRRKATPLNSSAAASVEKEAPRRPDTPKWDRKWPHDQPHGWNLDAARFLALIQSAGGMMWLSLGRAKYLELRVDTRDGAFNLYDRDGQPLNPDDVVEAAEQTISKYGPFEGHPYSPAGNVWQPISTAPKADKDSTQAISFIGWCPDDTAPGGGDQRVVWWEPRMKKGAGCWWGDRDLEETPTHWKQLGEPPALSATEQR